MQDYRRVAGSRLGEFILEHRTVVEKHLGRKLSKLPEEVVHHVNGNKQDNRIENLQVMTRSEHTRLHVKMRRLIPGGVKKQFVVNASLYRGLKSKLTLQDKTVSEWMRDRMIKELEEV